jgi:hypothetical protein
MRRINPRATSMILRRAIIAFAMGLGLQVAITILAVVAGPSVAWLGRGLAHDTTFESGCLIAVSVAPYFPTSPPSSFGWQIRPRRGSRSNLGVREDAVVIQCQPEEAKILAERWGYGWPFEAASFIHVWPGSNRPDFLIGGWRVPGTQSTRGFVHDGVIVPLRLSYIGLATNLTLSSLFWLAASLLFSLVTKRRPSGRACPSCGYRLADGLSMCSECGDSVTPMATHAPSDPPPRAEA